MARHYSIDERRIIDDDAYEARRKGSSIAPLVAVASLMLLVFAAFIILGNQSGETNVNNVFDRGNEAGIGGGPEEVTLTPTRVPTATPSPTATPTPIEASPTDVIEGMY